MTDMDLGKLKPLASSCKLSLRELVALLIIQRNTPLSTDLTELKNEMNIPGAALSRAIAALCVKGYVARDRHKCDKRRVWISLDTKGFAFLRGVQGQTEVVPEVVP